MKRPFVRSLRSSLRFFFALALGASVAAPASAGAASAITPIPIRVVVLTTFEVGNDSGDVPGEFQTWVDRFPLADTLPFPQAYHHLRYDRELGVLGVVTGEGAERGAASVMALGSDPRFDLSRAYWVLAGIAGVDPRVASVGSAAWARYVVNADLAFEIDARDAPPTWATGIVPFDRAAPYASPAPDADSIHGQLAYALNPGLVDWAYGLTAATPLADTPNLQHLRAAYPSFPNAQRPPFVLRGDSLCGDRFWVGPKMNDWAERWVSYWTGGRGTFAMTAEEDAGIMQSLTFLAQAGRVDTKRVLILRTASDYDTPGNTMTAAALLAKDADIHGESAYLESLDSAYRVGSTIVKELATHWPRYKTTTPGSP